MNHLATLQSDLAQLIVKVANISHIKAEDIDPEQSLMRDGLGLDSIDILEVVVNLEKKYGIKLRNDESGRIALANVRSLAEYTHHQLEGVSP
ncbi:MAG: phosphopantetheine-binding protein [Proteobacteria bacterium]|nr:phosphopantetheine-binding protein [Pseudomonadota bacterium]